MNTEIALARMGDLIALPKDEIEKVDTIMINLNSVFSVLFYPQIMDELIGKPTETEHFVREIGSTIKTALMNYSDKQVILYHASEPARLHRQMYPAWREGKYSEYATNRVAAEIWTHFYSVFDALKQKAFMIDLVDTKDLEPVFAAKAVVELKKVDNSRCVVISRDFMELLLADTPALRIWDGVSMFTGGVLFKKHTSKKFPRLASYMVRYWAVIKGVPKHNYPGARGYGEKKALKFIIDNFHNIDSNAQHILGANYMNYINLYDLDELIYKHRISLVSIIKELKF